MKKKCYYATNKAAILERCCQAGHKPKNGIVNNLACPKNTNNRCELITKEKEITVRGYAEIVGKKRLIAYNFNPIGGGVPCKIVMTAANYKRIKGGK